MLATTIHESNTTPHHQAGQQHASHPTQGPGNHGPVVSGPNSVLGNILDQTPHPQGWGPISDQLFVFKCTRTPTHYRRASISRIVQDTELPQTWADPEHVVLLRKEVIQPHLPVRLPCYDFVPIASPTFDGSLHKGWATGFGCCRLS